MSYTLRQNPAYYGGPGKGNYEKGRRGKTVNKIVIHHAASTSFDSIGSTFKKQGRMASAHYGVGQNNNVDQYVPESDMAWHAANEEVNLTSIGIENVNASGAPNWDVADSTRNTLVELVTDIVRNNPAIGKLVVGQNLFGHKDVGRRPTACPGQLEAFLPELANRVNANVGNQTPSPTPTPQPPRKSDAVIAQEVLAGAWGNNPERKQRLEAAGYNYASIQAIVNGGAGKPAPVAPAKPNNETVADQVIAGAWGNNPQRKDKLRAAGYNPDEIQNIVNRKLGAGTVGKKSNDQVANEVIAGKWGNGPERKDRIRAAGYDPAVIQGIVNKKLGF